MPKRFMPSSLALWPRLAKLFERIEHFEAGTPEVPVVARHYRQPMTPGCRCDVAVFDGHSPTGSLELMLLVSPDVCNSYVEPMNSSLKCIDESCQPRLKGFTPPPLFGPNPIGQLGDDDGAGIAAVFFLFEPTDDPCISMPLSRLADDISIEKPTHSSLRRAGARRRGGTSSGLTGQSFRTSSQLSLRGSRRNTSASSSGSKRASK